jgi:hypothetical protein
MSKGSRVELVTEALFYDLKCLLYDSSSRGGTKQTQHSFFSGNKKILSLTKFSFLCGPICSHPSNIQCLDLSAVMILNSRILCLGLIFTVSKPCCDNISDTSVYFIKSCTGIGTSVSVV